MGNNTSLGIPLRTIGTLQDQCSVGDPYTFKAIAAVTDVGRDSLEEVTETHAILRRVVGKIAIPLSRLIVELP